MSYFNEATAVEYALMMKSHLLYAAFLIAAGTMPAALNGQTQPAATRAVRTPVPTRDPHAPGNVEARDLPDGTVPGADADGNFVIGSTHPRAAEMTAAADVPHGTVINFTMQSGDSKIYPGIAREANTFGVPGATNPAEMVVTTSHAAAYTRRVAVYVPKQYVPGTEAPFIVGADGPDRALFTALDNLIAQHRIPAMVAISIGNGSGDAQGSERGLEYDTMSGKYSDFVETEVLPLVQSKCNIKLTSDPDGRATMGGSSGGSCALIMAWYHPERYHRVLTYSGTFVNQQWPFDPQTPGGAWDFHRTLIPNSTTKPLRMWMEVGDRDLYNPNTMRDNMHDWVAANENMARVLADKGYHYQFIFARNAGHTDAAVKQQSLPEAMEYLWKGYKSEGAATQPVALAPCMGVLERFSAADVPASGPAEAAAPIGDWTSGLTPPDLPGHGLAEHPMLYAGENYNKMFVVNQGKVIWSYSTGPGYEYDDVWMLSNGNILFSRMQYIAEITPDKKVIWRYDCNTPAGPAHTEVHGCQPIGLDKVLFVVNGLPPKLMVVNIKTGAVEVEHELPYMLPADAKNIHGEFRRVRYTATGTYLVPFLNMGQVVEYDKDFKEIWSYKIRSPWAALRLKNGNTLITDEGDSLTREVTPKGETAWEFKSSELPAEYKLGAAPQSCTCLANGNTIFCTRGGKGGKGPQLVEVTPDKKVAWVLQDWKELGPASAVQVLDDPGMPENPGESEH